MRMLRFGRKDLIGHVDVLRGRQIKGWAASRKRPDEALLIDVILRGSLVCSRAADSRRSDLLSIGISADHGFDIDVDFDVEACGDDLQIVARHRADPVDANARTNLQRASGDQPLRRDARAQTRKWRRPAGDVVFVDVTDLIAFLRRHNHVTGIQRVVSGYIGAVAADRDRFGNIVFSMLLDENQSVAIVDDARLRDLIDAAVGGGCPQDHLGRLVDDILADVIHVEPARGDVYFIAGAYWIMQDASQRLDSMRHAGVVVGLYVYDLIPMTHRQYVTESTRSLVVNRAIDFISVADFALTISEFVARELKALIDIELAMDRFVKAVCLPHQLNGQTRVAVETTADVMPEGRFVLCVGTLEARKNHELLFKVWAALIRKHGFAAVPQLVFVGAWGWNIDAFRSLCEKSNYLNGKIKVLNGIGDAALAKAYQRCLFTVFPSFVEGWGLPVGESLYHGKLCIASNRSSIPEVGGDCCVYMDPHDFFETFGLIERYVFDDRLRESHEARIAANFRARTWSEFSNDLGQAIALGRAQALRSPVDWIVPKLEAARLYDLRDLSLDEAESEPWRVRQAKFVRKGSWSALEDWGSWATAAETALCFDIDEPHATIRLLLELVLPPGVDGASRFRIGAAGAPGSEVCLSALPHWVPVRVSRTGDAFHLSIEALGQPRREPHRSLYFGLCRMVWLPDAEESHDGYVSVPLDLLTRLGAS